MALKLTTYLDESGTHDQSPISVMAGYIGTVTQWDQFGAAWSAVLRDAGVQHGNIPIVGRSVDPRSFFLSAEDHHCAHSIVHGRRDLRCQIDAFEEFLCCRACTLQTFCWPREEAARLPCGSAA